MTPGYDPRTCCTGCNSPSAGTQGACEDCGHACCSECAELVDRLGNPYANDLVCKACFARRVEESAAEYQDMLRDLDRERNTLWQDHQERWLEETEFSGPHKGHGRAMQAGMFDEEVA